MTRFNAKKLMDQVIASVQPAIFRSTAFFCGMGIQKILERKEQFSKICPRDSEQARNIFNH